MALAHGSDRVHNKYLERSLNYETRFGKFLVVVGELDLEVKRRWDELRLKEDRYLFRHQRNRPRD